MIRSPLFGEDSELHLKNMGMRGLDLTRDDVRDVTHLSMTSTNNAWQPSSSPTSSSPPRNNMAHWSERFHSNSGGPTAGLPDDGSFRGFSTPGGPISANWQLQAPGCPLPVSSSTPVTGARTSPIPSAPGTMAPTLPSSAVPHMLPMGQGLPPLPQIYSPFFDQMECRDANSSAAAAAVLGWPYSQLYYSYDPMIGQVGGYSTDIAAGRRKNATRETTSTLKAWLKEHKKNPYPTKGEKIMLAIISKMTLTQVSTWFANARRRLKKENKMMWDSSNNNNNGNSHAQPAGATDDSDADDRSSEKSNSAPVTGFGKAEESRLGGHAVQPGTESTKNGQLQRPKDRVSSATVTMKNGMNGETKPKIWSIVDTVRNPPEAAIPSSSSSSTPNGGARATLRRPRDELDTLDDDKASPVKKARFEVDLLSEVAGAGAVTASSLQHHHRVSSTNDKTSSPAGMESAGLVVGDETNRCDNMPSTSS